MYSLGEVEAISKKAAKAAANSDKGFKTVAAQKSTKPKRRLL